ncbi:acyl-CoA carboxylase epsilon subunit [Microbacterium sediminis]|uniref:Uncharacterized protein n=1 Tax=Microbacterium sediminis TaxID=904291 RepID=A0A1B9N7Z4_9MICO|nr:acyl-CoA carboxylase epsilon subunit [Microbacterium sediminis]OCG72726.1 hypothetical protein A7J15_10865 [Microbacterium sediminis]QBR74760.1 acyl-CoA carboxylase subunit epsilon [Microbacterium sediminis]
MTLVRDEDDARELPRVEFVRGTADEDDLAALAAVLPMAYVQEADEATTDDPGFDAWTASRRLRRVPPAGARWGRFSG